PLPLHQYDPTGYSKGVDWDTLLIHQVNPKYESDFAAAPTFDGGFQGVRSFVLCPEVDSNLLPTTPSLILHYSAHPRIFPDLEGKDWAAVAATGNFNQRRVGYVMSHIKRSSEIAGIFDASLYSRGGLWTTSTCAYALDDARIETTAVTPNTF